MTGRRKESFQQQAEQNVEAAALHVARSIQTPGQTKEQSKLIALGIAKGIAQYKKQQGEKARAREKLRKRLLKERTRPVGDEGRYACRVIEEPTASGARVALCTAAVLFVAASAFHLWRFVVALPITLGTWPLPVWWSLPIATATGCLGAWLLVAGSKMRTRAGSSD